MRDGSSLSRRSSRLKRQIEFQAFVLKITTCDPIAKREHRRGTATSLRIAIVLPILRGCSLDVASLCCVVLPCDTSTNAEEQREQQRQLGAER